jgi:glycosyltransferase involved in cell wall biosynthesis
MKNGLSQPDNDIQRKPRLLVVSTYDDLCGIAGYTRCLVQQLDKHFDVEVFDLDQFFMRSTHRKVRKLADQMIKDLIARVGDFHSVNIQLEHGTLGHAKFDILRRFAWIARAAPRLSVTFHTIVPPTPFPVWQFTKKLAKLQAGAAFRMLNESTRGAVLSTRIYALLRRLQSSKPVSVIVHTRRDMRLMKHVFGLENVFDHPLAFVSEEDARLIRTSISRSSFPALSRLPSDAKVVAVFGFLGEYKGFDVAVRALHRLPENYHLFFFGGVHPNEIKSQEPINPFVKSLLAEAKVTETLIEELSALGATFNLAGDHVHNLMAHPKDLGGRIHFLGAQTDADFMRGMAICDVVVLPYREVGQSSSGPMSMALDMGARIIAARNHAFLQFARYHPHSIEMFEIGNHLELAERLMSDSAVDISARPRKYNTVTNTDVYVRANWSKVLEPARAVQAPVSLAHAQSN